MKEAGDLAGLFLCGNLQALQRAAFIGRSSNNFMEPAKLRNIVDLLSLSNGQCNHLRRNSNV